MQVLLSICFQLALFCAVMCFFRHHIQTGFAFAEGGCITFIKLQHCIKCSGKEGSNAELICSDMIAQLCTGLLQRIVFYNIPGLIAIRKTQHRLLFDHHCFYIDILKRLGTTVITQTDLHETIISDALVQSCKKVIKSRLHKTGILLTQQHQVKLVLLHKNDQK
ncbi:hypothetical protein D9M68_661440 [compost metagenome]